MSTTTITTSEPVAEIPQPDEESAAWLATVPDSLRERLLEVLAEPDPGPPPTVHQAIAKVIAAMPAITKSNEMTQGPQYKYRSIEQIKGALHPLLGQHGIVYTPHRIRKIWEEPYQTQKGDTWWRTRLWVRYRIYGPAGDWIEAEVRGEGADNSDKVQNKAMTGCEKQMLIQIFCVDDGARDTDHDRPPEQGAPTAVTEEPWSVGRVQAAVIEAIRTKITGEEWGKNEETGRAVPPPLAKELASTAWAAILDGDPGLVNADTIPYGKVAALVDGAVTLADLEHQGDEGAALAAAEVPDSAPSADVEEPDDESGYS